MRDRSIEIAAFKRALEKHIFPVAKEAGLLVSMHHKMLYWLIASTFAIKFEYYGMAHGVTYSYAVTIYPKPAPSWYADNVYGIVWLAKYQGWELPDQSDFYELGEFDLRLASFAKKLPDYIKVLDKADSAFWESLHAFAQKEMASSKQGDVAK